jgi:hypothetical protein
MSSAVVYEGAQVIAGQRRLLFTVPLGNAMRVHMSAIPTRYETTGDRVVVVRADKFLALWQSDPSRSQHSLSHGNPDSWRNYYKYQHAAEGFARGAMDPVPLAEVSCETNAHASRQASRGVYALFSNGITRTIWLLTHGCEVFPVLSPPPDADLLQEYAGLSAHTFAALEALPAPHAL